MKRLKFFDTWLDQKPYDLPEKVLFLLHPGGRKNGNLRLFGPLPGTRIQRWYLQAEKGLSEKPPLKDDGKDSYQVEPRATTGQLNRWWTEMGGTPVHYEDRDEQDKKLLVMRVPR